VNDRGICPEELVVKNVSFKPLNMNDIPSGLDGRFNFNWSSCVVEHLGGIEKSMNFLVDNLKTLKSGGVAVHTLEFNLSSENDTSFDPGCFIFRKRDIEEVASILSRQGHKVYPLNFHIGGYVDDNFIDVPPYDSGTHLRLQLQNYVTTSFGLIVRKNGNIIGAGTR